MLRNPNATIALLAATYEDAGAPTGRAIRIARARWARYSADLEDAEAANVQRFLATRRHALNRIHKPSMAQTTLLARLRRVERLMRGD